MTQLFGQAQLVAPAAPPEQWVTVAEFFVPGIPKPGGSKRAALIPKRGGGFVVKDGRPIIGVRDDCEKNKEWRAVVSLAASEARQGELLVGTLALEVRFVMPRPGAHFGSGKNAQRLKTAAPTWHTKKPDATKLLRALEDALTGVLWVDDAQVARQSVAKTYGDRPGASVVVRRLYEGGR